MKRAADLLAEQLEHLGFERLFCVPGESYLALLDALVDAPRLDVVVCRHEGGAGFMALADAKLNGQCGCVAVSRGPGATNVSIAIHNAEQDAVPLLVLIGQVARSELGRHAFQEVDYAKTFSDMAKGVWEVNDGSRVGEIVARAVHLARSGTPGPVVVVLPEDMLKDEVSADVASRQPLHMTAPSDLAIDSVLEEIAAAERPLLIAGGLLAGPDGREALAAAAATHHLPVALTFKYQHIFDNSSPLYAAHLGFKIPKPHFDLLSEADCIIAVGTRLGDTPTQGWRLPNSFGSGPPLTHVYPDAEVIGRNFVTCNGLTCDPTLFLEALAAKPADIPDTRRAWAARLNGYVRHLRDFTPGTHPDGLDFGAFVQALAKAAPRDSIVTMDAGNFSSWIHRFWPWDGSQHAIGSAGGAMGLGVPAGVAACLSYPKRTVLAFCGDGGVMMTGNELATAVSKGAKPKIIVANNGSFGTIRQHQERDYPARVSATRLVNPDFAAWGRAFGALGITVATAADIEPAVRAMLDHDGPVVVDVQASVEAISAFTTIAKLRGAGG